MLTIQAFFKAKNSFHWILNINYSKYEKQYESMGVWVWKYEYESMDYIKKMKFLLGFNMKIVI